MESKQILMTGLSGFMGSAMAAQFLLSEPVKIYYLAESKEHGITARNQIETILADSLMRNDIRDSIKILICEDMNNEAELQSLLINCKVDEIWHIIANMSYGVKDFKSVLQCNATASSSLMRAAKGCGRFYYISTIGVAGINHKSEMCREIKEELLESFIPMNPYTVSKVLAEYMLWNLSVKYEIPLTILRPAAIIGDSKSGRAPLMKYGYYSYLYILKRFLNKKNIFYIDINPERQVPVIHVDHLTTLCQCLRGIPADNRSDQEIFHISNSQLFTAREHFNIVESVCNGRIKVQFGEGVESFNRYFNQCNADNNRFLETDCKFSTIALQNTVGASNLPPNLTVDSIAAVIDYYMKR